MTLAGFVARTHAATCASYAERPEGPAQNSLVTIRGRVADIFAVPNRSGEALEATYLLVAHLSAFIDAQVVAVSLRVLTTDVELPPDTVDLSSAASRLVAAARAENDPRFAHHRLTVGIDLREAAADGSYPVSAVCARAEMDDHGRIRWVVDADSQRHVVIGASGVAAAMLRGVNDGRSQVSVGDEAEFYAAAQGDEFLVARAAWTVCQRRYGYTGVLLTPGTLLEDEYAE